MDTELTYHTSAIAKWLLDARGDMSREKAARLIGVSTKTLQRAEAGETTPAGDVLLRAAAVYGRSLSELDGFVQVASGRVSAPGSRYIVEAFGYHPEVATYFRVFERELIRMDATDREIDYVLSIIRSRDSVQMIEVDDDGQRRDHAAMRLAAADLMEALGAWVQLRLAHRTTQPVEPIKPSDVPAAMEKRRSDLAVDSAKSKPSRKTK